MVECPRESIINQEPDRSFELGDMLEVIRTPTDVCLCSEVMF